MNLVSQFFNKFKWQIFVFFTLFVPLGTVTLFIPGGDFVIGLHSQSSIGAIAGAAYFAGLDWSRVISLGYYMGFGFTGLFFPLFLFDFSTATILLIVRSSNVALLSFCGVIVYNIMTGIFGIQNKKLAMIVSIAAACLPYNMQLTISMHNCNMQIFLDCVVLYLLLIMAKKRESQKASLGLSLLLGFIMCYGLLVHTRIIFVWGAVFCFLLGYFVINRKILVNIWAFLLSFLVFYFLSHSLIGYVESSLWSAGEEALLNSVDSIGWIFHRDALMYHLNLDGIIALSRLLIGQTYSIFAFTGGLGAILLVSFVFSLVCLVWKKHRAATQKIVLENKLLFFAILYTVLQLAAITFLTSYTSLWAITGPSPDIRWLVYHRYWVSAGVPVIFLSVTLLLKLDKHIARKLIIYSTIFLVVFNILFAYMVAPLLYGKTWFMGVYNPLLLFDVFSTDAVNSMHFLSMILVVAGITMAVFVFLKKQNFIIASAILLVFFVYNYSYVTARENVPHTQHNAVQYNHIITLFNSADIDEVNYPLVYARVGHIQPNIGNTALANLQFTIYHHSILPITHEPDYPQFIDPAAIPIYVTNNVAFDSSSWNMFFGGNHKVVDFGEDEYGTPVSNHQVLINTADTVLVAQIESAGYTLLPYDTLHLYVDSLRVHRVNTAEEPEFFLAPSNISLGVLLPAGEYELTLRGNDISVNLDGVSLTMPDGMTIADNVLTYSFTLDYSRTLEEFFSSDTAWGFVEYLLVNNIWYIDQLENMELRITERFPLRQLAAYELGTAIYFDEDNANYHGHILSGMPLQEEYGAWTQGHMAEFVFFLSDAQDSEQRIYDDLLFSFTAEPLVTPSYRAPEPGQPRLIAQRVEIEVNGEVLDVLNIIRHGTYEVRIPADLIADNNRLHIILRLPTATSPAALGIDPDDDRVLALFLEELRIFAIS